MTKLTDEQKKWWATFQAIIQQQNVNINNLNDLQKAVRILAITIIKQAPEQDRIVCNGQLLAKFDLAHSFSSKADFVNYHKEDGCWGDDSLLFPLLNALGYQPRMHLAGINLPAYVPFTQQHSDGLVIDIVNENADFGGSHWKLKDAIDNRGEGNCMYYTVAQQIQKDFNQLAPLLPKIEQPPARTQKAVLAAKANSVFFTPAVNNVNIIEEAEKIFKLFDKNSEQSYYHAKKVLEKFDTSLLIKTYHYALANLVGNDSYLKNRPEHSAKELGNDIMKSALKTRQWDSNFEWVLREELIHALAKEAWRNPVAYHKLTASQYVMNSVQACHIEATDISGTEPHINRLTV